MRGDGGVQSVERALDVLEMLASTEGDAGLSELAARTGLPYGTIHRLLRTLAARGYVRQNSDRKYALGGAVLRLGEAAERLLALRVRPYLTRLVEISGETANLAVLEGDSAVYVAQVPSPRRLRIFAEVGRHVLPHCTAVGKVLLAGRPEEEAEQTLRRTGLPRRTPNTVTDLTTLLDELAKVRAQGYAVDRGGEDVDVHCVAVPVVHGGRTVASMSISGPARRIETQSLDDLVRRMTEVADAFGESL
ncbi:MAG: helix-turn-helix domain-containing protein [Streptosporangiales bacterium]|nr:helix-turn-helix domain-containing protein [Streptosporangiales bacterium]